MTNILTNRYYCELFDNLGRKPDNVIYYLRFCALLNNILRHLKYKNKGKKDGIDDSFRDCLLTFILFFAGSDKCLWF